MNNDTNYEENYYAILGVSFTATQEEIKKAYRKLARGCHPDTHPGDPRCEEMFKVLSNAYNILCDSKKRSEYDEKIKEKNSENNKTQYTYTGNNNQSQNNYSYSNTYNNGTKNNSEWRQKAKEWNNAYKQTNNGTEKKYYSYTTTVKNNEKNNIKYIGIWIILGILVLFGALNMTENKKTTNYENIYSSGMDYINNKEIDGKSNPYYLEAANVFKDIRDYKDSNELYFQCMYNEASKRYDNHDYTGASIIYSYIPEYLDSGAKHNECVSKYKNNINVGDTLFFGNYEQDNNNENGKEPLEWKVTSINGNQIRLITKYIIDNIPYDNKLTDYNGINIRYSESYCRKWLNDDFYNQAFDINQKSAILKNNIKDKNDVNISDNVYIYSSDEAKSYGFATALEINDRYLKSKFESKGMRETIYASTHSRVKYYDKQYKIKDDNILQPFSSVYYMKKEDDCYSRDGLWCGADFDFLPVQRKIYEGENDYSIKRGIRPMICVNYAGLSAIANIQKYNITVGWENIGGDWYYYDNNGNMIKNGFVQDGQAFYHMDVNGKMQKSQWINDNGSFYYADDDGKIAFNTVIDGYQIGADGKMSVGSNDTNLSQTIGNNTTFYNDNNIKQYEYQTTPQITYQTQNQNTILEKENANFNGYYSDYDDIDDYDIENDIEDYEYIEKDDFDYEDYNEYYENNILNKEYEVRDEYPLYVLEYNEDNGDSYSKMKLPYVADENGSKIIDFDTESDSFSTKLREIYHFDKEPHIYQIEFEGSEITSQSSDGLVITIYGTVYYTDDTEKNIEVYCKCDNTFWYKNISYKIVN